MKALEDYKEVPIEGYENLYSISNYGNVISHGGKSNHRDAIFIKTCVHKSGYEKVLLCKNSKAKLFSVHRLVASSFCDKTNPIFDIVNHIDEVKTNNHYSNLEWTDNTGNWMHSLSHKLVRVGKVDLDGKLIDTYPSLMEASRKNGVRQGNISNNIKCRNKSTGGYIWIRL